MTLKKLINFIVAGFAVLGKSLAGFIIALFFLSGCATYAPSKFIDTKGHTKAEYVIYDRQCSRYHYFGSEGYKALDTEYYYACMEQFGYKYQTGESTGVSYNPLNW